MSRVFEALNRARGERNLRYEELLKLNDTQLVNSESVLTVERQPSPRSFHGNGHLPDKTPLHEETVNGHKSWRSRLEQLFFGRDLAKYQQYPLVALEKDSPESEQYKILREQIKRLRLEGGINTFSITSPIKHDGKTTVAANLAAVLALDYEESVLLIDGDLRAPGLNNFFNVPLGPGLAEYLGTGPKPDIKDFVQETYLPGLQLLPAGKPSRLSSELLAQEKMTDLISEIRSQYPRHQIIIDSPPILSTPDPLVIARHVDGVLMVIRAGKTPRDFLTKALQSLKSTKVMGVVLNGADLGIASKYYYYTHNR